MADPPAPWLRLMLWSVYLLLARLHLLLLLLLRHYRFVFLSKAEQRRVRATVDQGHNQLAAASRPPWVGLPHIGVLAALSAYVASQLIHNRLEPCLRLACAAVRRYGRGRAL